MTALTIDLDDQLIDALRAAAERGQTTIEDIVRVAVTGLVNRGKTHKTFRQLVSEAPLNLEEGWTWSREKTNDRSTFR